MVFSAATTERCKRSISILAFGFLVKFDNCSSKRGTQPNVIDLLTTVTTGGGLFRDFVAALGTLHRHILMLAIPFLLYVEEVLALFRISFYLL
jgi:hypothetical protein